MERANVKFLVLRIVFIVASLAVIAWIFSNSLANGDESTQQSSFVKDIMDSVLSAISGAKVDVPMLVVRKLAHFTEYFILGICLYLSFFFFRAKNIFVLIPFGVAVIIPIIDESLQLISEGRTFAVTDMLIDFSGAACGIGATLGVCALITHIYRKHKAKSAVEN